LFTSNISFKNGYTNNHMIYDKMKYNYEQLKDGIESIIEF